MYNLIEEKVIEVDNHKRIIILTYEVQDGAGFTIQKHILEANVP